MTSLDTWQVTALLDCRGDGVPRSLLTGVAEMQCDAGGLELAPKPFPGLGETSDDSRHLPETISLLRGQAHARGTPLGPVRPDQGFTPGWSKKRLEILA